MRTKILSAFLILNLVITSVFSQSINTKKLDSFFNVLDLHKKTMGSFVVSQGGKVVYSRFIGYSSTAKNHHISIDGNTVFNIGSIAKLFTSTMIFQLVDEKKLSLSTTLDRYFPQIPHAKSITIEQLLAHRSGLYDVANDGEDKVWVTEPHSKTEILDKIINGKPHFLPGAQMSYNNSGYILLALILEDITGKGYDENLQQRISLKIDLKKTWSPKAGSVNKNRANSYNYVGGWEIMTDIYSSNHTGADNILSTPMELISFSEALLKGHLISDTSLKSMMTFEDGYTGRGLYKIHFFKENAYGHDGDTFGVHSTVQSSPNDQLSISYCINGEVYPHNRILEAMVKICYGAPYTIPKISSFISKKKDLKKFTGVYYKPDSSFQFTIARKDNFLYGIQPGHLFKIRLYAIDDHTFEIPSLNVKMEFDAIKHQLTLQQDGEQFVMSR